MASQSASFGGVPLAQRIRRRTTPLPSTATVAAAAPIEVDASNLVIPATPSPPISPRLAAALQAAEPSNGLPDAIEEARALLAQIDGGEAGSIPALEAGTIAPDAEIKPENEEERRRGPSPELILTRPGGALPPPPRVDVAAVAAAVAAAESDGDTSIPRENRSAADVAPATEETQNPDDIEPSPASKVVQQIERESVVRSTPPSAFVIPIARPARAALVISDDDAGEEDEDTDEKSALAPMGALIASNRAPPPNETITVTGGSGSIVERLTGLAEELRRLRVKAEAVPDDQPLPFVTTIQINGVVMDPMAGLQLSGLLHMYDEVWRLEFVKTHEAFQTVVPIHPTLLIGFAKSRYGFICTDVVRPDRLIPLARVMNSTRALGWFELNGSNLAAPTNSMDYSHCPVVVLRNVTVSTLCRAVLGDNVQALYVTVRDSASTVLPASIIRRIQSLPRLKRLYFNAKAHRVSSAYTVDSKFWKSNEVVYRLETSGARHYNNANVPERDEDAYLDMVQRRDELWKPSYEPVVEEIPAEKDDKEPFDDEFDRAKGLVDAKSDQPKAKKKNKQRDPLGAIAGSKTRKKKKARVASAAAAAVDDDISDEDESPLEDKTPEAGTYVATAFDSGVFVAESPPYGMGLFARRRFKKGATIIPYIGEELDQQELANRYPNPRKQGEYVMLGPKGSAEGKLYVDAVDPTKSSLARYANTAVGRADGKRNNAKIVRTKGYPYIRAKRDIAPKEEILFPYGGGFGLGKKKRKVDDDDDDDDEDDPVSSATDDPDATESEKEKDDDDDDEDEDTDDTAAAAAAPPPEPDLKSAKDGWTRKKSSAIDADTIAVEVKHLYKTVFGKSSPNSLLVDGSTNSPRLADLLKVLSAMKLTPDSVFVDLGSGSGIPCIVAAMKYGCRTIGLEYNASLVDLSNRLANSFQVTDLCTFKKIDLNELQIDYFERNSVTHVYSFNAVFLPALNNHLTDLLDHATSVSCTATNDTVAQSDQTIWQLVAKIPISMQGSGEKKTFYVRRRKQLSAAAAAAAAASS